MRRWTDYKSFFSLRTHSSGRYNIMREPMSLKVVFSLEGRPLDDAIKPPSIMWFHP